MSQTHLTIASPALRGRSCCEINEDMEIQPWEIRWLGHLNFLQGLYNLKFKCDLLEKVTEERKPRRERGLQLGACNWNNSSISTHDEMNLSWQSQHEERICCSTCLWDVCIIQEERQSYLCSSTPAIPPHLICSPKMVGCVVVPSSRWRIRIRIRKK